MAVACLLVAGCGFGIGSWYQGRSDATVTVRSGGTTRTVTVDSGDSVGQALAAAGVQPEPGALRSVVTKKVLDASYAPAEITVGGRPASLKTQLADEDVIVVEPGLDAVEPVVDVEEPQGAVETVAQLRYLDSPGKPGRTVTAKGARSGEVVGEPTVQPAVAPERRTDNVVALTFDDGPGPYTDKVLDILEQKGVKATFCVIGRMIPDTPASAAAVRRITAEGHALCNHTENHDESLPKKSQSVIDAEMDQCIDQIAKAGGARPIFYRPPGGNVSPQVIASANAKGMQELHWSVDTNDWKKPGVGTIVSRGTQVMPGAIILMHDGGGDRSQTVAALPTIIDRLRAMGYTFELPASTLPGAGPAAGPLPPDPGGSDKAVGNSNPQQATDPKSSTTIAGDGAGSSPATTPSTSPTTVSGA